VVDYNHMSILHGYGNMEPQIFCGHDLGLLGSRDVIGHVTIGLAICGFLNNYFKLMPAKYSLYYAK